MEADKFSCSEIDSEIYSEAFYIYTLSLLLIAGTNLSEFSGNQQNC